MSWLKLLPILVLALGAAAVLLPLATEHRRRASRRQTLPRDTTSSPKGPAA
ncbi:MAG: hypothetical protein AAF371_00585 [Pseudomonadota bacterium]